MLILYDDCWSSIQQMVIDRRWFRPTAWVRVEGGQFQHSCTLMRSHVVHKLKTFLFRQSYLHITM